MLVGKESYCDFQTIQAAIDELERRPAGLHETLYILSGVYEEAVRIYRSDLTIVGIGEVEITMNLYARMIDEKGQEYGTFKTPTLFLGGRRLTLVNLTVSNTAGQGSVVGQALAVTAHCDETVFSCCTFKGHQDTLFVGPLPPLPKNPNKPFGGVPFKEFHDQYRQLYTNCRIEGTVDFIFGGATAYFDHCQIHSLPNWNGSEVLPAYITAASTPLATEHGFIFNQCYLTAEPGTDKVYLGRPWRPYAKTDFVDCQLGPHILPEGWHNWDNPENEATVRYREFDQANTINRDKRVTWAQHDVNGNKGPRIEDVFVGTAFWKREGNGNGF